MRKMPHEIVEYIAEYLWEASDEFIAEIATKVLGKDVKWDEVDGTFIIPD